MTKNILSEIDKTIKKTEDILSVTKDKEYKEQIKQLFMCKQLKTLKNKLNKTTRRNFRMENLKEKHYLRMNGLLLYDLEGRDIKEQKIILKAVIEVANNLLEKLNK